MSELTGFQKVILTLLAFIFPPLPVFMLNNYVVFSKEMLLSVLLTILGHLPGVLYSIFYIFVEFPKQNRSTEGYIQITDDEETNIRAAPRSTTGENSSPSESRLGTSNVESAPLVQNSSEDEPPNYEEIAGSSKPNVRDSKDNKVQHQ
ncbi:uncharacterized protein PRCAT00005946001 [Priceomyces carsonii]|uniref:uncharacterized protein n=1 Tax=Priceomyces carsonii TaxID=28549 RepID=UPI002EDB8C0F|nr:unnamed protein product [Priceomyces carsonii]